jgi:cell division protein FtsI (penicillin-binding protein 3)
MTVKNDILLRVYFSFLLVVIFGGVIVWKQTQIIFKEGEYWRKKAEAQHLSYEMVQAVRGNIYSDDGSLLATSVPVYEIRIDFKAEGLKKEVLKTGLDSLALLFSKTFKDKSKSQYLKKFNAAKNKGERYFLLRAKVSHKLLKEMRQWPIIRLGRSKGGIVIIEKDRREKPFKHLAERTIGYSKKEVQPVGLEGAFNDLLGGVSGMRLMQKVSGNVKLPINDENEIEPENGNDIYTTIDINLQDVAEDALREALVQNDAAYGSLIVMEVATGHIKAISNLTRLGIGNYKETYNYAIGESSEPGSTIKLASLIALLEEGLNLEDSIDIEYGKTQFFDKTMLDSDYGQPDKARKITLQQAFEQSSNVAFSKLVQRTFSSKPEKFVDYLKKMGLNTPLNLQIPGEGLPKIKDPKEKNTWYGTTLPWMSIGYEIQLTPLQILCLYNAVANDGKFVRPLLVKEVRKTGEAVKIFETEVLIDGICKEKTLEKVRTCLESVVENGTGSKLKNDNYKVAGKTGTTQIDYAQKSGKMKHKASFVGYFPAENPKYSCIVNIVNPSGTVYYGGSLAGPVFKSIADRVYASKLYLAGKENRQKNPAHELPSALAGNKESVKKLLDALMISSRLDNSNSDNQLVSAVKQNNHMELIDREYYENTVPDVTQMSLKDAIPILENCGLRVRASGTGKIYTQSKIAGSPYKKGESIYLLLQ